MAQVWRWQLLQQLLKYLDDKEGKELLLVGILETFTFNIAKVRQ
jgi:hypothetical protein